MTTGYVFNSRYMDHELMFAHPESPERLRAIQERMQETCLDQEVKAIADYVKDPYPYIREIHADRHIRLVKTIPETGEIAELAVSGVLGAVDAVSKGIVNNAFCAIRPPGHHAHNSGGEEGFCFYNNVAIAARYAQSVLGHKKIVIMDWDFHHGNGTQDAFYDDPSVLFFSTHNWFAYPGTGDPSMIGDGPGRGFNINVHMDAGANDDTIRSAWEQRLVPAVEQFEPDFVLLSAGFDSREDDLLGNFSITDEGFADLTRTALQIAKTYCNGRLVSLLEGGYNPEGLAQAVVAHVGALVQG